MKALILAAGYGRRLYPITRDYPKPLLLIRERPIIDYIVDKLDKIKEIDDILVVTNDKFIQRFKQWKRQKKNTKRIKLINDLTRTYETRLGALGDIDLTIKKTRLKDDLLVIGGDNLFDEELGSFISCIGKNGTSVVVGVYDIKDREKANHYGVVDIDRDKRIIGFEEKPAKPKTSLVAMCLYYFPEGKLSLLDEYLSSKDKDHDASGSFINWLYKKEKVFAFEFKGRWFDIGQHYFYEQAGKVFDK